MPDDFSERMREAAERGRQQAQGEAQQESDRVKKRDERYDRVGDVCIDIRGKILTPALRKFAAVCAPFSVPDESQDDERRIKWVEVTTGNKSRYFTVRLSVGDASTEVQGEKVQLRIVASSSPGPFLFEEGISYAIQSDTRAIEERVQAWLLKCAEGWGKWRETTGV